MEETYGSIMQENKKLVNELANVLHATKETLVWENEPRAFVCEGYSTIYHGTKITIGTKAPLGIEDSTTKKYTFVIEGISFDLPIEIAKPIYESAKKSWYDMMDVRRIQKVGYLRNTLKELICSDTIKC